MPVNVAHEALARTAKSCWVGWRALLESPMFAVFVPSESSLKKVAAPDLSSLPESAVWIDLAKPTAAEDKAAARLAGIAVPTREGMPDGQVSSRASTEDTA